MELLNLRSIFFEALSYPEYARPNFYLIKQQQSVWSKGIYLTTLEEVYHACHQHIDLAYRAKKRNQPNLKRESISIPIKEVTKGNEETAFDEKMIESLFISVRKSWSFNIEPPKYSAIEILSFAEHSLAFIKSEFSKQISNHYNIATDGPYFDSQKFRVAARKLLFSARNLGQVTALFKNYRRVAMELVNLWNNKLYFIEQEIRADGPPTQPTRVNVELTREFKTGWHHNDDLTHFEILYPQLFTNQNFAYYAAHIANLLPSSTLQNTQEVVVRDGIPDFMTNLKTALKILLVQNNAECIENVKRGNHWEASFRDWFDQSFTFLGYTCSRESIRGKGHIDLHVHTKSEGDKIIEFKGWWDSTRRRTVVQQVCQYLTQFEGDGYIVMINHTQKPIDLAYQKIVCTKASGYVPRSWKKHRAGKGIRYYSSRHRSASGEKEVYHFIISIF